MPTGDNSNVLNHQEPMISYNNFDTSAGNAPTIGLCRSETEQVVVSSSSRAAAAPPAPIAAPPAAALAVMVVVWNHLNSVCLIMKAKPRCLPSRLPRMTATLYRDKEERPMNQKRPRVSHSMPG